MRSILLGNDRNTGKEVYLPRESFRTHYHLIGGTGKGKTTAIHTMLHALLKDNRERGCFFIFDQIGNLSHELLLWMASRYCTPEVRDRLVYIEPSQENVVLGFNPLLYGTPGEGFYKVSRATDIILRAWEDVNIEAMPRLARWTFNAFWAAAQLGLNIADCVHFLMPWSPYHKPLLGCLPDMLKFEWEELVNARSAEAIKILESSRNRLKPYFESPILRQMFGATENRLDVRRFMREGKIVILNLKPANRLSEQVATAIGGLVLNEVFATARSLPLGERYPTYLFLDEFQNFVGPDIEAALPEVRQLGLRLVLSHQSLSQLKRGDYDLTAMIFQAQSRMIFGMQGEDADLLAHELASITFDPMRIKDELYSRQQLVTGHKIIDLQSSSFTSNEAENWAKTYGKNWGMGDNTVRRTDSDVLVRGKSSSHAGSEGDSRGGSKTSGRTEGTRQSVLPEYEQFLQLMSRTYVGFEEFKNIWARDIRRLPRGTVFARLVDDPTIYQIDVKKDVYGHLAWDIEKICRKYPEAIRKVEGLIENNFQSEFFVSPAVIERETQQRIERVLRSITMHRPIALPMPAQSSPVGADKAFPE